MIKTVIIEDEKLAARKLERILNDFLEIELVKTLHSVEESVDYFKSKDAPDLIFSDIVLGDGLSFDIFEKVEISSFIIYTTAFDDYTLQAFKLNSIDYLLKPIDTDEVKASLDKYKSYLTHQQGYHSIDFKQLINTEKPKINRVISKVGHHLKIVPIEEVFYFYSENKMVYAQTIGRAFPTDFTLEELENSLDENQFFRINRQTIIQLSAIESIRATSPFKVSMKSPSNEDFTISRDRVKGFKEWIA